MTDIYDIYSLITGWAVGFYIMASLFMYMVLAIWSGLGRNQDRLKNEDELTGDYFDEIENTTTRRVGHFAATMTWATVFSFSHVAIYALLAVVVTRAYIVSSSTSELVSAGADFHPASMVYAWLLSASFMVAAVVAWQTANVLHLLVFSLTDAAHTAISALADAIIKRKNWMVEKADFVSFVTMLTVTAVMTLAFFSVYPSLWKLVWISPAFSGLISAWFALKMWRQHRDAETLIKAKAEVLNEQI